ncbi:MAG: hypothetical protein Sapg2KO_43150 [Saprospiraceae bacterium]
MTVGNKGQIIGRINEEEFEKSKKEKQQELALFTAVEQKGLEENVLAQNDTSVQAMYEKFITAIDEGNLMEPEGESANWFYKRLIIEPGLKKLHGNMRRNFAAALQDASQIALQELFYDTEKYYASYHTSEQTTKNYAKHLNRAAELLGEDHYMFNSLKAREYYFGVAYLKEQSTSSQNLDSLLALAIDQLETALKYDSSASFIYKELGDIYSRLGLEKAMHYYKKATELSPNWAILHADFGFFYRNNMNYGKAIVHINKAIELDSTMIIAYQWLYYTYTSLSEWNKRYDILILLVNRLESIIRNNLENDVFPYYYYVLGETYWVLNQEYDRAKEVLLLAQNKVGDKIPRIHTLLGEIYKLEKQFEAAEEQYNLAISKSPSNATEPMSYLADMYLYQLKDYDKAENVLLEVLELDHSAYIFGKALNYESLGVVYLSTNQLKKAELVIDSAISIGPHFPRFYSVKASLYKKLKQNKLAEESLNMAIEKSVTNIDSSIYNAKLFSFLLETDQPQKAVPLLPLIKNYLYAYYSLAKYYLDNEDQFNMEQTIKDGLLAHPESEDLLYGNACLYSLAKNTKKAIQQLQLALEKGFDDYNHIQQDEDLNPIRDSQEFKQLMKKYFPEK